MRENLKQALTTKLEGVGEAVKTAIVDRLYKAELDARTEATVKVVTEIDKLDSEISKIKAKPAGYGADDQPLPPTFSPQDFDKRAKLVKRRDALDAALAAALTDGNFVALLKEAANVGKSEGGSSDKGE